MTHDIGESLADLDAERAVADVVASLAARCTHAALEVSQLPDMYTGEQAAAAVVLAEAERERWVNTTDMTAEVRYGCRNRGCQFGARALIEQWSPDGDNSAVTLLSTPAGKLGGFPCMARGLVAITFLRDPL